MKKIISLALASLLTLSVGVSCGKGGQGGSSGGKFDISSIAIPEYVSEEKVDITAYSGPTVENWSGSSRNVNTITEEHYRKMAEAGFTKVLALHEGAYNGAGGATSLETIAKKSKRAEEHALLALEQAAKFGIKYYVRDWTFYGFSREVEKYGFDTYEEYEQVIAQMFSAENPYIHHEAYGGNFAFDEPTFGELDKIAWQVELYKKYMAQNGATGEPMINLYPSYVGTTSLNPAGHKVTYREYVEKYFDLVAPQVGYVSYDFYPFLKNQYTGSSIKAQFLYNLELMATLCKETRGTANPVELRTFMQAVGDFTGLRPMSCTGDFRLQVYSALAFGSKEIIYYTYAGKNNSMQDVDWSLLNYMDGTYNWTYDSAKMANNEVHAMEDAYLNFEWEGSMFNNADPMYENRNFAYLTNAQESHPRIGTFTSTQDTLLTFFKDKDDNDAFMLVNFTDPYFQLDDEVTVQFKDAKALLMYRLGQKIVVPLNTDGTYTFKLYPGEGRFIIPLK